MLSISSIYIATIDSSGWSSRDAKTWNCLSGCGSVVINGRLDAGVNSRLNSSTGALSVLISARLKRRWQLSGTSGIGGRKQHVGAAAFDSVVANRQL